VPHPEETNKLIQQIKKLEDDFIDEEKFKGHSDKRRLILFS